MLLVRLHTFTRWLASDLEHCGVVPRGDRHLRTGAYAQPEHKPTKRLCAEHTRSRCGLQGARPCASVALLHAKGAYANRAHTHYGGPVARHVSARPGDDRAGHLQPLRGREALRLPKIDQADPAVIEQ